MKELNDVYDYICLSQLIKRFGLSISRVEELFGPPDLIVPNPHNASWAPMKKYLRERVIAILEAEYRYQAYVDRRTWTPD